MNTNTARFVFFGTPAIAVTALEILHEHNLIPSCIVTAPDKPAGRGMHMTAPAVKVWADEHHIPTLQPETLNDPQCIEELSKQSADVFVVVAYGKLIPRTVLDIPKKGVLNMHPSLLPHHRGPSPIEAQIQADDPDDVGVSIMLLDEKMDHGPLLTQTKVELHEWPIKASELIEILAYEGGMLLAQTLPLWVSGEIEPTAQDHTAATYCEKIQKQDAILDLENGDPYQNYLKICAYDIWPRAFFFTKKNKRVIVTEASYTDGLLTITRVIPEGKKEMSYTDFLSIAQQ